MLYVCESYAVGLRTTTTTQFYQYLYITHLEIIGRIETLHGKYFKLK